MISTSSDLLGDCELLFKNLTTSPPHHLWLSPSPSLFAFSPAGIRSVVFNHPSQLCTEHQQFWSITKLPHCYHPFTHHHHHHHHSWLRCQGSTATSCWISLVHLKVSNAPSDPGFEGSKLQALTPHCCAPAWVPSPPMTKYCLIFLRYQGLGTRASLEKHHSHTKTEGGLQHLRQS